MNKIVFISVTDLIVSGGRVQKNWCFSLITSSPVSNRFYCVNSYREIKNNHMELAPFNYVNSYHFSMK